MRANNVFNFLLKNPVFPYAYIFFFTTTMMLFVDFYKISHLFILIAGE